jgi:3-oxoacyl-[acyl-carrier-protein] synthase-1
MSAGIDIISVGMVTAVGLDAPSSCAAMRARLDGFQGTRFRHVGDKSVLGAPVPMPRNWIGEKRMAHLGAAALSEALEQVAADPSDITVLLCLAEESRPGRPIRNVASLVASISSIVGFDLSATCKIIAHGRPSGHAALDQARTILHRESASNVVILGIDSYLTQGSISYYMAKRRLLTDDNPNGFIPGEAASAILCAKPGRGQLELKGLGLAREHAAIYNAEDIPLRADGMTSAYRLALSQSGIQMNDIGYRISDLIGELFWFKQTALANLRLSRGPRDFIDLWSPGESLGNIGAAVVPVMIGMAWVAAKKRYCFGNSVLIEASNDSGACGAAVLVARAG